MKTFELHRLEDATGISGTGIVAQGVEFDDGTCALRWLTEHRSTALYVSMRDVEAIHGHAGKTKVVHTGDSFARGYMNAYQDMCENAPFASVGGLEKRTAMVAPRYITPAEHGEYIRGYRVAAQLMYGKDWETCTFGWAPALNIGGGETEVRP